MSGISPTRKRGGKANSTNTVTNAAFNYISLGRNAEKRSKHKEAYEFYIAACRGFLRVLKSIKDPRSNKLIRGELDNLMRAIEDLKEKSREDEYERAGTMAKISGGFETDTWFTTGRRMSRVAADLQKDCLPPSAGSPTADDEPPPTTCIGISGAVGTYSKVINGCYAEVEEKYNGCALYQKDGEPDYWLRVAPDRKWNVTNTAAKEANSVNGVMVSVNQAGLTPSANKRWNVAGQRGWQEQATVKVTKVTASKSQTSTFKIANTHKRKMSWKSMRDDVVLELCSTERSYIKNLTTLLNVYLKPLAKTNVVPTHKALAMQKAVEGILGVNQELQKQVDAKFDDWDEDTTTMGDVIVSISPWLKLYHDYVAQFSDFALLCNKTPKVKNFLRKLQKAPPSLDEIDTLPGSRMGDSLKEPKDIEFYGIMPVQRIPKYKLFMEAMLKHTPPSHPDMPLLKKALASIKDVADFLNQQLHKQLHLVSILRIQNMFSPPREDLLVPGRRFVREGRLLKVNSRGKAEIRYIFLFSDVLVYATRNLMSHVKEKMRKKGDRKGSIGQQEPARTKEYKFRNMVHFTEVMPVAQQKVYMVSNAEWKFQFRVVAMEKSFVLVAQTQQQLNEWVTDIGRCAHEQRQIREAHRAHRGSLYHGQHSVFTPPPAPED